MRFNLLASFLVALPLAVSASAESPLDNVEAVDEALLRRFLHSTSACPRKGIHIVAAPGAGGTGPLDYGYLNTTIKAIQKAIPGSNNFCLGPYHGSNGLYQTENAEVQARKHIGAFHKKCPHTPIAVVGYSTGGIGAMNLLCGSSPAPPWRKTKSISKHKHGIFAMTTFGVETRSAGAPYNAGSCHSPYQAPMYPRTTSKGCHSFFENIKAWCDIKDGDCCNAPGAVDGGPAHFAYPQKYNHEVVKFIRHRLRAWHKKHGHKKHHHKKHHHKKHHHGGA